MRWWLDFKYYDFICIILPKFLKAPKLDMISPLVGCLTPICKKNLDVLFHVTTKTVQIWLLCYSKANIAVLFKEQGNVNKHYNLFRSLLECKKLFKHSGIQKWLLWLLHASNNPQFQPNCCEIFFISISLSTFEVCLVRCSALVKVCLACVPVLAPRQRFDFHS